MGFVSAMLFQDGLARFYDLRGCLGFARHLFDGIPVRDGLSVYDCWDETWKLFDSMSVEGNVEPEEVTTRLWPLNHIPICISTH